MNKLIFAAAAAAAFFLYKGSNILNRLTYRINSTKFDKFNINQIVIVSNITIFNRSSSNLNLKNFEGVLFYKDQPAATINAPINTTIGRKEKADINIYYNLDPLNFFNQLSILLASRQIFGNFKIKGVLKTDGFNIPIIYTPDILPN
jgi:hypothetical protein